MKKISQTITGIPLRQTNPAAIERFIVQKIRDDLGEFKDLAVIKPILRIDTEDGDLSGNITNGFGTVSLDIQGVKVYLPFIIHDKELLPFDVIRMGEQEVVYDLSKLRKIVNGIDKHVKENGASESVDGVMSVVDPKDVPNQNGFLGTIMNIRDEYASKDINGVSPYEGLDFGSMDEDRFLKSASEEVDVLEVFEEAIEKIANVTTFDSKTMETFLSDLEKETMEESQKQIDLVSGVDVTSLEKSTVNRELNRLNEQKMVDISRVASGNDITIPVVDDSRFEYRSGRVYHKFEEWSTEKGWVNKLKSLIIDSKGHYKFVKQNDKVMVTLDKPRSFKLKQTELRALKIGHMYTIELNPETIKLPFMVKNSFTENESMIYYGSSRKDMKDPLQNSLFQESFECEEVLPAKFEGGEWTTNKAFQIIVSKDENLDKVLHLDQMSIKEYIQSRAVDPEDAKLANCLIGDFYGKDHYIIPGQLRFLELEKNMIGNFTRPDGFFKEGPLVKSAAYHSTDSATLVVTKDSKPKKYAVKWQYSQKQEAQGKSVSYNIEKKQMEELSEAQSKKVLQDLGYDFRQIEMFMEITNRNGRSATFRLPDVRKARSVVPKDKARDKVKQAFKNIANSTLNANNFMPVFSDILSDGASGFLSSSLPQSIEWTQKWDEITKSAYEAAVGIEKIANDLQGESWYELAALTNLKYRMDKMASEVVKGAYLNKADDVFASIEPLQPVIEKHAHSLIEFNRKQILNYDKPPLNPTIIKEALHSLDGLSKYASFNKMLKNTESLNKEAGFFRKFDKQDVESISGFIKQTQETIDKLQREYRDQHIYLRSLKNSPNQTLTKELNVENKIEDLNNQIDEKVAELNQAVQSKDDLFNKQKDFNRKSVASVGVPGLASISYGYETTKN